METSRHQSACRDIGNLSLRRVEDEGVKEEDGVKEEEGVKAEEDVKVEEGVKVEGDVKEEEHVREEEHVKKEEDDENDDAKWSVVRENREGYARQVIRRCCSRQSAHVYPVSEHYSDEDRPSLRRKKRVVDSDSEESTPPATPNKHNRRQVFRSACILFVDLHAAKYVRRF